MILTMKELAEYLKINERTVQRMIDSGQIRGRKVGGQYRFKGSDIDKIFFPEDYEEGNKNVEPIPLSELTRTQFAIPISRLVTKDSIFLDMKATDMDGVIKELTAPKLFNSLVLDIQDLRDKCLAREKLLNTGIGNGIAIPHPRDPISTLRRPGCVVIGRSTKGVDYFTMVEKTAETKDEPAPAPKKSSSRKKSEDAVEAQPEFVKNETVDGKPVNLFFLICAQTIELHLHIIGKLAKLLKDQSFIDTCMSASTPDEIIRAIMVQERAEFAQ